VALNYSFGFYRNKRRSNKKTLKIEFKVKNCSANCGCYEPIKGGKAQRVPLQSTSQLCMEGLRQNAELTKKTICGNKMPTRCNHLYNTLELLMIGIMVPETC
jgi:hypothetical protein